MNIFKNKIMAITQAALKYFWVEWLVAFIDFIVWHSKFWYGIFKKWYLKLKEDILIKARTNCLAEIQALVHMPFQACRFTCLLRKAHMLSMGELKIHAMQEQETASKLGTSRKA